MPFTHRELCDLAVLWLKRPVSKKGPGCHIAFSESRGDWYGETPDAIGFRAGVSNEASVLIEVKTSRSDFLADRKKPHRKVPESGMGKYRYYMAPEGLLQAAELPPQWGLIEVSDKGRLKVRQGHVLLSGYDVDNWQQERAMGKEWTLLTRLLNRVGDAEKVQNWLKESRNINARLVTRNERLAQENERLSRELFMARNSEGTQEPAILVARRKEPIIAPMAVAADAASSFEL
ncbi:MAG: adenylosuccinate synthase [Agitococcus sp.]|nr:adenylosuccinate synthase [Agitococcus sp.]